MTMHSGDIQHCTSGEPGAHRARRARWIGAAGLLLVPALAVAAPQQAAGAGQSTGTGQTAGAGQTMAANGRSTGTTVTTNTNAAGTATTNGANPGTTVNDGANGTNGTAQTPVAVITNQGAMRDMSRGGRVSQRTQGLSSSGPTGRALVNGTASVLDRQALAQSLTDMSSRLDSLLGTINASTGTERTEAMALAIQEMAGQIAQLQRLLFTADLAGSASSTIADNQAIFITPGGAAQGEARRRGGLDAVETTFTGPGTGFIAGRQPGEITSSLAAQAERRRQGATEDPLIEP